MNWFETPDSSSIARFRYLFDSSILEIEFKKSGTYQYFDVPEAVVQQLQNASSKGLFFAENIKGIYRYARI